jgi:hypothetical protein
MERQPGSNSINLSTSSEPTIDSAEASNKGVIHFGRAIFMIGLFLAVGAGFGMVMGLISKVYFSIYILPVLFCVFMGLLLAKILHKHKVHVKSQAIFLAILMAGVAFWGFHYVNYLFVRGAAEQNLSAKILLSTSKQTIMTPAQVVDANLREMTGYPGFIGYVLFMGQEGMSVGSTMGDDSHNIGSLLTWLYWSVFLLVAAACNIAIANSNASKPVCPVCGEWMEKAKFLGNLELDREPELIETLQTGDLRTLKEMLKNYCTYPKFVFYLRECTACHRADMLLIIQKAVVKENDQVQFVDYRSITIRPAQATLLETEPSV